MALAAAAAVCGSVSLPWTEGTSRLESSGNGICAPCVQLRSCAVSWTDNLSERRKNGVSAQGSAEAAPAEAGRRRFFHTFLAMALGSSVFVREGLPAIAAPIPGYKQYLDRFDGYSLSVPQSWMQVRGAGADVFFRAPRNLDENVMVDVSSPSSSRYKGIEDLGTPQDAAEKVLKQYLTEFMSTRLGVRRESSIVSVQSRTADDGKLYYEVEVNVSSYANNNQLAVMPEDRVVQLEWSRRYLSVLGVENSRLYQLRLQTPEKVRAEEDRDLRQIMNSFRVIKVEA